MAPTIAIDSTRVSPSRFSDSRPIAIFKIFRTCFNSQWQVAASGRIPHITI